MVSRWLVTPVALLLSCLGSAAWAAPPDPSYQALRNARPDGRQLAVSRPFALERDAFRFQFDSGAFHFLAPVDGRTVGAVFVGKGSFRLTPASEDERHHLGFMTGKEGFEVLTDSFDELVLLFADDTFEELGLQGEPISGAPEGAAGRAYGNFLDWQRVKFRTNFHVRLLCDLLDTPALKSGVFLAFFDGSELPPAVAAVDPRGAEALRISPLVGGEDSVLFVADDARGGFWYASDRAGELRGKRRSPYRPSVDALHYAIDTEVRKNEELVGTTTMRLRAEMPVRVVPLTLVSTLRIQNVEAKLPGQEDWREVPFIQEKEKEDADPAVILPEILPKDSELELRLSYRGREVVWDFGFETWGVVARESWYPNAGIFLDLADYDLTYRVPPRMELISVGKLVSSEDLPGARVSVWRTEQPIRVAGFNYGQYQKIEQKDEVSGLELAVFTRDKALQFVGRSAVSEIDEAVGGAGSELTDFSTAAEGPKTGQRDPKKLAQGVLVDNMNAARLFHSYFGPLPQSEVSISQQAFFNFGQSWPSLIYLPSLSFMTGTDRNTLGATGKGVDAFVGRVAFHEMAHQWWGHLVGWESYRDQWLSEGFAEFSAALAVQHTEGWDAYAQVWQDARELITTKVRSNYPTYQVGPITRGWRLSTAKSPAAYSVLAYSKGGFVLHMLRMLMWDPGNPQPDARFIAMMKDFTSSWAGKSPSTADFKQVVERHMVPAMNATGDGKIDWFFDQWVYGTEVPRLKQSLTAKKLDGDQYQVTGEVSIEGVSEGFFSLVPLYADFGKGRQAMFGRLPFKGPSTRKVDLTVRLPEKPKRIVANARHEVLTLQ